MRPACFFILPKHRSLLLFLVAFVLACFWLWDVVHLAPDYRALWEQEEHESDRWSASHMNEKGQQAPMVMFRQLRGAGFNNQIQETLLLSYLVSTLSSHFTYVPPPITWQPRSAPHNLIPLSAFLTGLPAHPSEAEFNYRCPTPKKLRWETPKDGRVEEALEEVLRREAELGVKCLMIQGKRVVDWSWLETDNVTSLYPSYARNMLSKLSFSPRVLDATDKVIHGLSLDPSLEDVLAVHLRRGDFATHCPRLSETRSTFTGWNRLVPSPAGLDVSSKTSFLAHCYPTVQQMVETIEAHLESRTSAGPTVTTLYVLHDFTEKPYLVPHLRALELALLRSPRNNITRVRSSSNIQAPWSLPWEDRDLVVAVDMELGRRAGGGFIANGWSSLSATVVGWRMMSGTGKGKVSFW